MNIFNLASFLEKFKHLKDPRENKTIISRIIFEISGVKIDENYISIQKQTAYINGSSLLKSRVFMKKGEIVAKINDEIPGLRLEEVV